jgi:glycosyltransferase involved in cell wall biosynthesis
MKILVVQDRLRSGGTERQTILLAKAFRAAGHSVAVITFRPGGAVAASLAPVSQVALQPFDTGLDWWAPGLRKRVHAASPDVVLCMGKMAKCRSGALQRSLSRTGSNAIVIGTMRTGKALPRLFRRSLQEVRHIVANSNEARAVLENHYTISPAKISVIPNALVFPPKPMTDSEIEASRADLRSSQGATENTLVMLCVAMFRPEKNQCSLINLAAQLPPDLDWQLWLAGAGETLAEVKSHARASGLETRIKFLGFLDNPTPLYRAADLAVLASLSESLPNFLIEAHAHGLPSVAFDVGGVKECGGRSVAVGADGSFRAEIVALSKDSATRRQEGERLEDFARASFSPEKQVGEYLRLFENLLRGSR